MAGEFSYFRRSSNNIPGPQISSPLINPEATLTLTEAIPLFIKQMELRGSATSTQASYVRSLRKFAVFSKKEDNLNNITIKDIQDFLHHQHYICQLHYTKLRGILLCLFVFI